MLVEVDVAWVAAVVLGVVAVYVTPKVVRRLLEKGGVAISVPASLGEAPSGGKKFDLAAHQRAMASGRADLRVVKCWDPATLDDLGEVRATRPEEVREAVARARRAQAEWRESSFATRRQLLRTMLKFCVEHQMEIARVACRDSGKTLTDAVFGEILVTCEKLKWLIENSEAVLAPEARAAGTPVVFTKSVRVESPPLGVIGAIVPWNYPFHNVMNPVSAALAAGDAIVVKVSEYASWSTRYYGAMLEAALAAVGAPRDLVQFVHGYGATGEALVAGGCDKIIFVGSPQVGRKVMETASKSLTPVVLELGGKDPFVVCDDVDAAELDRLAQIALRGVFQSMGQNCAGPERFFVARRVYDAFCDRIERVATRLKTGASLADPTVDCGAVTMGALSQRRLQALVDDALAKGAVLLAGGAIPTDGSSFYPPTVLKNVPASAELARAEIFGPIMCIFDPHDSDEEAIAKANDCQFALSSCAFAKDAARALRVASKLKAGMSAVNDLEGTTYLSQSLPFGGLGLSGFDRFAGPEGLRGMCAVRSVCVDKLPALRTAIPAPMQYPSKGKGHIFAMAIVQLFYAPSLLDRFTAIFRIIKASF
mmetsp:Transcript_23476/g.73501  ORF Transcript_23476/g.73501 Transcript_23476/m.73501 type:complete len:595 (+) Transcript_23476:91-1875(+)